MNDRRKSSRNGKEEHFHEEVSGKRLDDWEDIGFAFGSHGNRQNSGGTLYRLIADGFGDGPPKACFSTNNNHRYGIKHYRRGSTETYSKEFKRR